MSSGMGKGYWLNPENLKFVQVERHEISAKDKHDQKALGLSKEQMLVLDLVKGSEDAIRLKAVKVGLIRLRDTADGVHVQFYAERGEVSSFLDAVLYIVKKTELKNAWTISIENMHPSAKDYASLPMEEFKSSIEDGKAIMKESRKRR
jgi:hypothetical protein